MSSGARGGRRFLVMISYEIDIGYAIGRLVTVFHEMARRLGGDASAVHFSFSAIGDRKSANLPAGFSNLLEFNYRKPDPAGTARFIEYIRSNGITDLFALDMPVNAPYLADARRAGVRDVVAYWGAPMSGRNRGLKLLAKRLEVALLRRDRPDLFLFESEAMRDLAVNGRGLPRSATAVFPTGVDESRFHPVAGAADTARQRFGIPAGNKIICYMGHLHERKGVHVLMQAMQRIVKRGRRDIHALFLGNRNNEERNFAAHYAGAESQIVFGGYQTDIPQLLAGCYAGCIPSTGWDSFPMSSIEMQACGLPVIVSDWQGVPETVANGVTGIVTPVGNADALADAIVALADDPARRQRMSEASLARIAGGYTREHQIRNLVDCLAARGS